MNYKKNFFLACAVMINCLVVAQQLPQFTQYMLNDYVINPAFTGKSGSFEAKSDNRYQWQGITDAPRTYVLSLNGPIKKQNIGVGGYLFTDITGPTRRTGLSLSYGYHLKISEKLKASLGLSLGLLQFAVDASKITLQNTNDIAISNGFQSSLVPDFGFGGLIYNDQFFVGVSAPQIYPSKLKFFNYVSQSNLATHIYLVGGYKYPLSDVFVLEPTTLIKFVNPAPPQIEITGRLIYQKKVWAGFGVRMKDAITAMIGYTFQENLTIGYSYDMTTSNLKRYSSGSNEIYLAIRFYRAKKNPETASGVTPIE